MRESHCNTSLHYRNRWVGFGLGFFLFFKFHILLTRRVDSFQILISQSLSQLFSWIWCLGSILLGYIV
ncbi:hypothetical protein Lalb_Chr18g0052991 [Lupinus albus]|uniref:Uncharacterized protein n=1 Tax=Lupinus albus TaxID=3870 RepID=A0A6A4NYE8_LUPAL|nr:hypothetical protein Lalb_Chr18g0052991 [Lupinus albus]